MCTLRRKDLRVEINLTRSVLIGGDIYCTCSIRKREVRGINLSEQSIAFALHGGIRIIVVECIVGN